MKPFTKGFAAGAVALTAAVPLLAQTAFAARGERAPFGKPDEARPVPTQACVQAMADLETARLSVFDQESADRKAKMQAHRDALVAASKIADDAQRQAAMKAAMEDLRPDQKPTMPEAVAKATDAVKAACGDTMAFKDGMRLGEEKGMKRMMFRRGMRGAQASSVTSAQ